MLSPEVPMNPQIAGAGNSAPAQQPPVVRADESLTGPPIRFIGKETFVKLAAERLMTDPGDVAGINAISTRYGITILGPPIAARPK
jgi:hypothetical protein